MKALKVEIDENDLMRRIAALPKKKQTHSREWKEYENRAIIENWDIISREDLARELKCSKSTLNNRYHYLVARKNIGD